MSFTAPHSPTTVELAGQNTPTCALPTPISELNSTSAFALLSQQQEEQLSKFTALKSSVALASLMVPLAWGGTA